MKKLTKLEVAVVLSLFGLLSIIAFNQIKKGQIAVDSKNTNQNTDTVPQIRMISVAQTTPYIVVSGEYPQFVGVPESFNKEIKETIEKAISEHAEISKENWDARRDTASAEEKKLLSQTPKEQDLFPFFVKTDIVTLSKNLVSVLIHYGGFQGGAHGFEAVVTFNYDLIKNKQIHLADVFDNDSLYLTKVSDFAKKDLMAQFKKKAGLTLETEDRAAYLENIESMIEEGTLPKAENFAQFTLSGDALTFYFGQYQVAPYVEGEQRVVMPIR